MLKGRLFSALLVGSLALFTTSILAAQEKEAEKMQQEELFSQPLQEVTGEEKESTVYSHIYGADLMTEEERCQYLLKLDGMESKNERDALRTQHRQAIDKRRKQMGG